MKTVAFTVLFTLMAGVCFGENLPDNHYEQLNLHYHSGIFLNDKEWEFVESFMDYISQETKQELLDLDNDIFCKIYFSIAIPGKKIVAEKEFYLGSHWSGFKSINPSKIYKQTKQESEEAVRIAYTRFKMAMDGTLPEELRH